MALRRAEREENMETFVRRCVERYRLDPLTVNIISATSRAFMECWLRVRESRIEGDVGEYLDHFTREIIKKLYEAYSCDRLRDLFVSVSQLYDVITEYLAGRSHVFDVKMTTVSRTIVHTKSYSLPLEISLAWDPLRNLPYLPSSALKGVIRSYFEESGVVVEGVSLFELFGFSSATGSSEGALVILDAYPVSCQNKLLDKDILTPHYSEARYSIDETSSSPTPLPFMTVARDTTFRTLMIIDLDIDPRIVLGVMERVREALETGVGAKTSLGYGRLRVSSTRLEKKSSRAG